jgi:hypothetical protein
LDFALDGLVVRFEAELDEDAAVLDELLLALELLERALELRSLALDFLRALLVVPKAGFQRFLVELLDPLLLAGRVKDAPARCRGDASAR